MEPELPSSPDSPIAKWLWYLLALPPLLALFFRRVRHGLLRVHGWFTSERTADRQLLRELADKMGQLADALQKSIVSHNGHIDRLHESMSGLKKQARINAGRLIMQMNNSPLARFECRMDGSCSFVNAALAKIWQAEPASLLEWGWLAGIHAADIDRVRVAWLDAVHHFVAYRTRYRIAKTGVEVEVSGEVIRCDEGEPILFTGTIIPVSELP